MKRTISFTVMGIFIATAVFAQRKADTTPVEENNPIFMDTIPQTQHENMDTTFHQRATEPYRGENQMHGDTAVPRGADTMYQRNRNQGMDTSYPNSTENLSQPPLSEPAKSKDWNQRKRTTPPLQHRDNPPAMDTSSGGTF